MLFSLPRLFEGGVVFLCLMKQNVLLFPPPVSGLSSTQTLPQFPLSFLMNIEHPPFTVTQNVMKSGCSIGPLAHPLPRSLTPLTLSLTPHCSPHLRAPLRSFARSLTHSLQSSWERGFRLECIDFISFQPSVDASE